MATFMSWIEQHQVIAIIRALVLLVLCLPLLRFAAAGAGKLVEKHFHPQAALLTRKSINYAGSTLVVILVLRQLGFNLTALLGAAGIAGVAIGFASQTSLSNLISGLFLIWERPFQVGDVLNVSDMAGVVHSIDLLSVQIRTYDNKLVRIPNESLIKTSFTNVTRFPIRRMDLDVGVAYKEDVDKVVEVLKDVTDKNPYSLDEPTPLIVFKGFGDSALQFMVGVWFLKTDYLLLRNSILKEIKTRFDQEGIEIPFPHRTLYAGSRTEPFPVRVVGEQGEETLSKK